MAVEEQAATPYDFAFSLDELVENLRVAKEMYGAVRGISDGSSTEIEIVWIDANGDYCGYSRTSTRPDNNGAGWVSVKRDSEVSFGEKHPDDSDEGWALASYRKQRHHEQRRFRLFIEADKLGYTVTPKTGGEG